MIDKDDKIKLEDKDSLEERGARFADIISQRNYYSDKNLIIKADAEKIEEAKKNYKSLFKK